MQDAGFSSISFVLKKGGFMHLELNLEERQYLNKALERYLSELTHEIVHTDTREYRQGLKTESEVLSMLKRKLEAEADEEAVTGLS
jgi:hypothetical protein